jgi:hypothetical protein
MTKRVLHDYPLRCFAAVQHASILSIGNPLSTTFFALHHIHKNRPGSPPNKALSAQNSDRLRKTPVWR